MAPIKTNDPSTETYTFIDQIRAHLKANDDMAARIRAAVYEDEARARQVTVDAGLKRQK